MSTHTDTFRLNDTTSLVVEMTHDPGDMSVGIQGGWEEISATIKVTGCPDHILMLAPHPEDYPNVDSWRIIGHCLGYRQQDKDRFWLHAEDEYDAHPLPSYPLVYEAVRRSWEHMHEEEALHDLGLDHDSIRGEISELEYLAQERGEDPDREAIRRLKEQAEAVKADDRLRRASFAARWENYNDLSNFHLEVTT